MTFTAKWAIGMSLLGLLTAIVVYVITDSFGWAVVGLLAAGIVVNALFRPRPTH